MPPLNLSLEDFRPDAPYPPSPVIANHDGMTKLIDGVSVTKLTPHADARGTLFEILTMRGVLIDPIVHVYHVTAAAGSCRAWVYHRFQDDRLAFVTGRFRVALYDIRPSSPTQNMLNVFTFGATRPALLRIPSFVIHGVKNIGDDTATFVNLPTNCFDPSAPDKYRLPLGDPRIPFSFDD